MWQHQKALIEQGEFTSEVFNASQIFFIVPNVGVI